MSTLPAVERPNGKLYRPRKLRYVEFDGDDAFFYEWPQAAVLGTHDVEEAREFASRCNRTGNVVNGKRTWLRQKMRDGDPVYEGDPVHGAACVVFDLSDDPEEGEADDR